ncbi:MAG TPA: hypothetical protein VIK18_18335 [Pirellulales bacterium]
MSNRSKSGGHAAKKPLHRSWLTWLAVLLMLIAMGVYLGSMDESHPAPEQVVPPAESK